MAEPVNRDRESYTQQTRTLISAIARAYFDGDEDAAWERYFNDAENLKKRWPQNYINDPSKAIMWTRPLRK